MLWLTHGLLHYNVHAYRTGYLHIKKKIMTIYFSFKFFLSKLSNSSMYDQRKQKIANLSVQQNFPFQFWYSLKVFLDSAAQTTPGIGRGENRLASTRGYLWSAWPSPPPPWPPVDGGGGRGLRWFYPYCVPHWWKFWVTPYPMFMFYFSSDFKEPALKNFIINGVYMISTEPDRYSDINVDKD